MKIEFDPTNPDEVAIVAAIIGGEAPAPAAEKPAPRGPAANRPTTPAAGKPASRPAGSGVQARSAPAAQETSGITAQDFAAAVQNYAKVKGPAAAKAVFAELGATKISDIAEADYENAITYFAL